MKYKLFPWLIGFLLLIVIVLASFAAPNLTQIDPAMKQNKVTFNAPFTLHFSHIMNRKSVEEAFTILPKTKGEFMWKDFWTLEFVPEKPLAIGDEYRIILKGEAKSIWLKEMGYDTTINYLVTGPPYVLFVDPTENAPVIKEGAITVMFDRPMDLEGKSEKDLLQIEPTVSGRVERLGLSAIQFIPKTLSPGEHYEVTIPAGLIAVDGGETAEDFSWTISAPDLSITKSMPEKDAKKVALSEAIRINFDNDVSLDAIKPGVNALLYPSNDLDAASIKKMDGFFNTEVTHDVDENGETRSSQLVFSPTFPYLPGESYRFVLKSDKDLPLEEDFELIFETVNPQKAEVENLKEESAKANEEVIEPPSTLPAMKDYSMDYFVRGENPRLKFDQKPSEPVIVSACQVSSNDFIRISSKNTWENFECENDSVTINPEQLDKTLVLDLNDHFNLDWVTGVYFASLTQDENKVIRHFLVEDAVLLLKRSEEDLLVWALDIKSGEPVTDMTLEILNFNGEELARGKTDEKGIYKSDRAFDEGIYVRGKKEAEGSIRWGLTADRWVLEQRPQARFKSESGIFLALNQHVFSPGESLEVKGIWRSLEEDVLVLPSVTQVVVTIEDPQGNFIVSKRLALRRNGSFDGTLTLPENSLSGRYYVTVSDLNYQRLSEPIPISVQRGGSDLKLEWLEASNHHIVDVAPVYIVKARYENGIPASSIKGQYQLLRRPYSLNRQEGAVYYNFSPLQTACRQDCENQALVKQGEIEFDADGEVKLILTDDNDSFLLDGFEYDLLVTAQLPGREPANLNHSFKVHQGGFDLGLGLKHALVQANESIEASVISQNFEGDIETDKKVKVTLAKEGYSKKVLFSETLSTSTEPNAFSIPIDTRIEDGVYKLRAESQDEKRNKISAERLVYVSKNLQTPLSENFLLAADQPKYFVGGRVHLIINDPDASENEPVPVIVTYERDGLLGYEAMTLSSPVTQITVPIKEAMMPHFIVKVTRFHRGLNPSFSTDTEQIDVGSDESEIFIDLDYTPEVPQPGKEVTLKIKTYDYQNRPLSSIVTLNVLDSHEPGSDFSYKNFFTTKAGPMSSASNISLDGGRYSLDYLDSTSIGLIEFARSTYFNPLIETNAQGEAEVTFTLPKARKDWGIEILATRGTQQFGYLSSTLRMNQQLQIQPILPSFVLPGDQTSFAASVKNISDESLQSRLELVSADVTVKGDAKRNFSLQPGQQDEIAFSVFINDALEKDDIEVTFKSENDLFELTVPLKHLKSSSKVPNSGLLNDIWTGRIHLPKEAYPGLGTLELSMSGSPLATAIVQAKALENYDYDSTHLLAVRLITMLQLVSNPIEESELHSVQSLVSSLLKQADSQGAYRYWNETAASPTLTALVLWSYWQASENGVHIDSIHLNRSIEWLWKTLEEDGLNLDDKSFVLWVLGQHGQFDTERALSYYKNEESASIKGRAFMLLNLDQLVRAGQSSVTPMLDMLKAELVDEVTEEETFAYFDASPEITAIMLYTLAELEAVNPLLNSLVKYLVYQGGDLYRLLNPEEALWMILGFRSYSDLVDHSDTNFIAQVKLNGTLILDQSFTDSSATEIYQTSVAAKNLSPETINDLFIKKEGMGPLYLEAHLISYLDPTKVTSVENGLIVVRSLYEMTDGGQLSPAATIKKGKTYMSQLKMVVPETYKNVALTDFVPAGMKLGGELEKLKEPFNQRGVENGVVTYYAPVLPAGVYTINTPMQAILPGHYLQLPATLQPMFKPTVFSQTQGSSISIID